jgi:hypothetical protein
MTSKITIYLNDAQELQWFAQFQAVVANYRANLPQNEELTGGQVSGETQDAAVVGHIQPKEEPKVEYPDLEKVVMVYLNKYGVPATRQKIADFGYPQLDKVPAEKWAELKALFEGWLA